APTMTMSNWWWWTPSTTFVSTGALTGFTVLLDGGAERGKQVGGRAGRAGVEGEDHERAEHDEHDRRGRERALQHLLHQSGARVVVHERAHAVGAVDDGEPEHQHVPPLPERFGPLAADEPEV